MLGKDKRVTIKIKNGDIGGMKRKQVCKYIQ